MAPTGDPPFPPVDYYGTSRIPPGEGIYGPQKIISSPNASIPFNSNIPITADATGALAYKLEVSFEKELVEQLAKQVAEEIDKEILNGLKANFESSMMNAAKATSPSNMLRQKTKAGAVMPAISMGDYNFSSGSVLTGGVTYGSGVNHHDIPANINLETLKKDIEATIISALAEEKKKEEALRLVEKAQEKAEAAKTKISRQEFENIIRSILQEQEQLAQQQHITSLENEITEYEDQARALEGKVKHLENQMNNLEDLLLIERAKNSIKEEAMNKKLFASYNKRTGSVDKKVETAAPTVVSIPSTLVGNSITVTPFAVESIKKISYDGSSIKLDVKMEDEFDDDLEEEEMEEETGIVQTLKNDSKLVAKRVAARKVVSVARDLLVSMLSAGKTKKEATNIKNTIGLMLQTDDGKAVLSFMLGAMLPLILAQLPEKYHDVARDMAQEFRVEGMAHFGTMLTDFVTGPAFQGAKSLITSALDEAMDTKEDAKATGVRVANDLKNEKQDEDEEATPVKQERKKNNHVTS